MTEQEIRRINELYHKSKESGLTEAEAAEQADLRRRYIQAIRASLRGDLDSISVQEEDGTITRLKDVGEKNRRHMEGADSETGEGSGDENIR